MSANLLTLCLSLAATFLTCAAASFLIWGSEALNYLLPSLLFASPVFIFIFAAFYFFSAKYVNNNSELLKQKGILFNPEYASPNHEYWSKAIKFLGYLEVASGLLCTGVFITNLIFTTQPILLSILNITISIFVYISGLLLLNKKEKGLKFSLICQILTLFSIKNARVYFRPSMIIQFNFSIKFGDSAIGINIIALIFAILIFKTMTSQPNNLINRTENTSVQN
ncbi:hypothetical protein EDC39_102268 [Geothermobacter ehrlichii]|uniref:Uncharacterized protein n=1 Tax=Geothermobacter ehrlichii TaxID=213224 RepID=A0A5D3WPW3_9BACT|nr:hypothetical protein [Geothermobacter ehrlichii]TYO99741.1 hypothetical protein EDC39_102268 [Geothermobacter ehrlichii]